MLRKLLLHSPLLLHSHWFQLFFHFCCIYSQSLKFKGTVSVCARYTSIAWSLITKGKQSQGKRIMKIKITFWHSHGLSDREKGRGKVKTKDTDERRRAFLFSLCSTLYLFLILFSSLFSFLLLCFFLALLFPRLDPSLPPFLFSSSNVRAVKVK